MRRARPWDGEMCFPLHYVSGSGGAGDARRLLIRAFKNGEFWAAGAARSLLRSALLEREDRLTRRAAVRWLVPLPGHLAGPAGRPLDRLCQELVSDLPWLAYRPGLLVRTRTIRQSSTNARRPTVDEHSETLCCRSYRIDGSVIMVDDVFTHGHISTACRQLLTRAGGFRRRAGLPRSDPVMRARVFRRNDTAHGYAYVGELDAEDVDDVWRQLEAGPPDSVGGMRPGDVVYVGDVYFELDGDGGWRPLLPGELTRQLYGLIP